MTPNRLLAHFDHIADAPDVIPSLRRFILALAVSGRLVRQDERDEPAIELYRRITEDRKSAIQRGVFKPIRNIPEQPDSPDWNTPPSWALVPLPAVIYFQEGPGLRNWQFRDRGIPFLNIRTLQDGKVNRQLCQFVDPKEVAIKYTHFLVREGDILCSTSGTIGKLAEAAAVDLPLLLNTSIVRFCPYGSNGPTKGFIKIFLQTDYFLRQARKSVTGSAQVNMGPSHLKFMTFPLPPHAEQRRIVAKVDELMALCDSLEAAQAKREARRYVLARTSLARLNQPVDDFSSHVRFHLNHLPRFTTRPDQILALRQTILNLAVRGKLVPQDPSDEPVSKLLKRIDAVRSQRVSSGERRADAESLRVLNDHLASPIPSSWTYRALADLMLFIDYRGKTPVKTSSGIRLITAKNVRPGVINREPEEFVSEATYEAWMTRGIPQPGDVLFTTEAPMGNAAVVKTTEKFALAQRTICFRLYGEMNPYFVALQIAARPFQEILDFTATGLTAKGIKAAKLKHLPFAVAPLAEQQRIVAKVDELMDVCDQLQQSLADANARRRQLLEAVLHEALVVA